MSSYRGPSFVLNERKTSLNSFIDSDFFPLYCAFDLRNEFEKFRTFLARFGPEFVTKLLSYSAIYFISVFFSIPNLLGKLESVLPILPISSFITRHVFFALFLNSNISLK